MSRYRKIDPRMWDDEKFITLERSEKLVAIYAITAQSNRIGLFKFSPAMAGEHLGMSTEEVTKHFETVCERMGWRFDSNVRVLYIPTWWKYNKPENIPTLRACLSDLHDIAQTHLRSAFIDNTEYLPPFLSKDFEEFRKAFTKPCAPKQEQEQEQDNTPISPKGDQARAGKRCERDPAKARDGNGVLPSGFMRFWSAWPAHERKIGRANCVRIWNRAKLEPVAERVIDALERCKVSRGWTKDNGDFIPAPERWLKKTPWESDPTETCGQNSNGDPDHFVAVRPAIEDLPWNRGAQ
jgi:hypothetical protein